MPTHGRPDGSGLCDDEGDVAQYLGMEISSISSAKLNAREQAVSCMTKKAVAPKCGRDL